MSLPYLIVDVFTDTALTGNPLAVFPDAGRLSADTMQKIAVEMHLSETIFVLPPEDAAHTARVRIFTPAQELRFAGHPTVGVAIALASLGRIPTPEGVSTIVLEEGVGPVPVRLTVRGGRPVSAQLTAAEAPSFLAAPPDPEIAAMIGLELADIVPGAAIASCGSPFLCVELASREALARARGDGAAMAALPGYGARGIYLIYPETPELLHARLFGMALGIIEDPATGSAAVALGALLASRVPAREARLAWTIEQGVDMGRPSRLELEAEKCDGVITAVRVGGGAVIFARGEVLL
ncbi:PhzF family phenazine biosynthesis protein [Niveibacterium terrae]|uniref:PhzF family phenazine biosynthesis protein n=1 Tax=Niveibacterium terrae TaxID=3373598 RepID=UPI003A8D634C